MGERDRRSALTAAPIRDHASAGGVVFRRSAGEIQIAVIKPRGQERWQLPKGIVDAGESPETAAVRETWEETGVESEIIAPLETIEYWYRAIERGERVRIHKRVHFFLLTATGGEIGRRDREIDEARWVPLEAAATTLTFPSERRIVEEARALLGAANGERHRS